MPPPIPVRLDRVRLERSRIFGDVWLGWTLWRALQLDTLLERLLPVGREAVPWATMALVLVLARLCEPSSELHIAEDWYRRTALDDLLALPAPLVNDDRCYRALDRLLPHKTALGFLAYVPWKSLEQWQQRAGLGRSPRTILEELGRIQSTDIVLPTTDGREMRLRCVVRPDLAQARLLDRLGLDLPERLRICSAVLSIGEM
jgi:hypothetical protein